MVSSVYRIFGCALCDFLVKYSRGFPIMSLNLKTIEDSEGPQGIPDLYLKISFPKDLYKHLFEKALRDNGVKYKRIL